MTWQPTESSKTSGHAQTEFEMARIKAEFMMFAQRIKDLPEEHQPHIKEKLKSYIDLL
jgi:hypothetical protein